MKKYLLLSVFASPFYVIAQVTSVDFAASPSSVFNAGGGPITSSGTLTLSMDNQTGIGSTVFLAGPILGFHFPKY